MRKPTTNQAALEYINLKADLKRIEARVDELADILKSALREAEDEALFLHGFRFKLSEYPQENFSLKKALEVFDRRSLAPFITTSKIVRISMTWQGGEEKAA